MLGFLTFYAQCLNHCPFFSYFHDPSQLYFSLVIGKAVEALRIVWGGAELT